jgi:addiction module HigA family antidote
MLKEDVLPELGLTVTQPAQQLGASRIAFSRVINGRAPINADLAIRLSQWLGGRADIWLQAQLQYDLWHAEQASTADIKRAKLLTTGRHGKTKAAKLLSRPIIGFFGELIGRRRTDDNVTHS